MRPRPHVLVVDNEAALTEVIGDILREDGYRVTTTNDARNALRAAEKDPPTLVLSDIMMPDIDGLHLLAEIRRRPALRGVPVLFFTAAREDGLARQLGAWDVLRKPAGRRELLEKVFEGVAVGFVSSVRAPSPTRDAIDGD